MIDVLDHGFVRLVDHMGSDISVVRAARVSYQAAWRAGEDTNSDTKLIRYLWKNKHTSPFESVEFQFEVKAPIFVLRQWHRHRTWSYNELSGRYKEVPDEYYIPTADIVGTQDKDNKQIRDITILTEPQIQFARKQEIKAVKDLCEATFGAYRLLLETGWPRELARIILPLNTYSHMFAKVNLLNLLKFLNLRLHTHAQYEIRQYAEALVALITPIVPTTIEVWQREINNQ